MNKITAGMIKAHMESNKSGASDGNPTRHLAHRRPAKKTKTRRQLAKTVVSRALD
jgi:hypothetical protein